MMIGENIKRIRKEKGLTQIKLAELSGLTISTVRNYEEGNTIHPKIETLTIIANTLETSVDSLVVQK